MHIHHLGPNIHVKENLPVAKQGVCLQLHSRLHQFQSKLERERESMGALMNIPHFILQLYRKRFLNSLYGREDLVMRVYSGLASTSTSVGSAP